MIKAIFIDRDGVINKDPGGWTKYSYITELADFHFLPGSLKALRLLNENRVKVIIVSNQAGVSKGYFTNSKLEDVNSFMLDEVGKAGGRIEEVYYCVHKDEDNCNCRKPKTGMLDAAIKKYRVEPKDTYIIGDSKVDMLAGKMVGMKTIFVLSGKTGEVEMKKWVEIKPDYVFGGLLDAVKWILAKEARKADRAMRREESGDKG